MELLSTDKAATSLQVGPGGPVYKARDGVISVENPSHARVLRQMGAGPRIFGAAQAATEACQCGAPKFLDQRICGSCYRKEEANA